ncbi:hypothetical protein NL533_35780, partial [Klebsiella pneumoniae]|nr:hypothetical protein [Klebsiella pneumoniae]
MSDGNLPGQGQGEGKGENGSGKTVPYERFQEVVAQKNELAQARTALLAELKQLQDASAAWS